LISISVSWGLACRRPPRATTTPAERVRVENRPAPPALEQGTAGQFAGHGGGLRGGQRCEPQGHVGQRLRRRTAEPAEHHGAEDRVVAGTDHEIDAGWGHRLDQEPPGADGFERVEGVLELVRGGHPEPYPADLGLVELRPRPAA
jgi:hypothetical protein